MNTWNPRQEILSAAHRWYWIVACFLLGALLGWLVSFIWPAPYRSTLDLYVGLNAYRASQDDYIAQAAGDQFSNLDDFKHWQQGHLVRHPSFGLGRVLWIRPQSKGTYAGIQFTAYGEKTLVLEYAKLELVDPYEIG